MDPLLVVLICVFVGLCTFRLWFPPLVALLAVAVSIVSLRYKPSEQGHKEDCDYG